MYGVTLVALLAAIKPSLALVGQPSNPSYHAQQRGIRVTGPAAEYTKEVKHFACGTNITHATPHFLSTVHGLHAAELVEPNAGSPAAPVALTSRSTPSQITVPLYMHIVTTTSNQNMVTAAQATAQFRALNSAYAPYGVQFTLANTTWTTNNVWAVGQTTDDDLAMKNALRQGTYGSLNLYFQSDLANGVLGKCTLPTSIGTNPPTSVYAQDGCNIALGTMPNGPIMGYNLGKTAVHETGHWLGLLHTFEGYSCTGTGDLVADTPAESQSTNGCPTNPWKNTCSNRVGVDPIHNYMDYSTDACYERFTPGQQARMHTLWGQYRQGM